VEAVAGGQSLARILAAIEGFFVTYGEWPSIVRLTPGYIAHLQSNVLSPSELSKLKDKITLVPDVLSTVIAENQNGLQYNYGTSGFPKSKPPIRARDWLWQPLTHQSSGTG
jgi:hypothetical protein